MKNIKTISVLTVTALSLGGLLLAPSASYAAEDEVTKPTDIIENVKEFLGFKDKKAEPKEGEKPEGRALGHRKMRPGRHLIKDLADYLDMKPMDLVKERRSGKSFAQIIEEQGKDVDAVTDYLIKKAEAKIDEAVKDGKLTEEKAEEIKESLPERIEKFLTNAEVKFPGKGLREGKPENGPREE